jgi:hypothetical protein
LLSDLVDLYLGGNQSELCEISTLQYLNLEFNALTGTLPTELGSMQGFVYRLACSNQLNGLLPPQLGNLSSLTYLNLLDNKLAGVIPR